MQIDEAFLEYHNAMVSSMTAFSRDEQAAHDAVQQAFLKAMIYKPMLEGMPEPAMKAWLYATARNALIDGKRKQSRLVYHLDETLRSDQADPLDRITVEALVEQLPPDLKQPLCMKYYAGMNSTQIGLALGVPPSTVRSRLRSAIGMMRRILQGEEPGEGA